MSTIELRNTGNRIDVRVFADKDAMGAAAASLGAEKIRNAISKRGSANIVVATGTSQFEMLTHLVQQPGIAWNRVTGFHLDEYVGISINHPSSFGLYLWQRFVSRLPVPLRAFHFINGEGDVAAECDWLRQLIEPCEIDVAFVGIGENAHLAFNDPPADFNASAPYAVVKLDEACRRQQCGEGWFPSLDDVPTHAISMSIKSIMASRCIVCTVPDARKSQAVRDTLLGEVAPSVPASILQIHKQVTMFLDEAAASRLTND